ncbi:ABC transporter ATP-binding protein [bacterium]|nr:ABC transporter ATP-binding protein [bacterium]
MRSVLETQDVRFSYSRNDVLIDVCVRVHEGEFLGIIGPNGAGKTTLLKILSGILQSAAGTVVFRDQDLHALKRANLAREMAFVPQPNEVGFSYTAAEIVLMGRYAYSDRMFESPEDFRVCQEAMRATDTLDLADRYFNELSGGERQRVMIASALAQRPTILFLDEPTASLDINFQTQILQLLKSLNREQGQTIVASMHDLNLAALCCERLLLIDGGQIVANGTPAEVLKRESLNEVYGTVVDFFKADNNGRFLILPKA